jgi:hypothetical protein
MAPFPKLRLIRSITPMSASDRPNCKGSLQQPGSVRLSLGGQTALDVTQMDRIASLVVDVETD